MDTIESGKTVKIIGKFREYAPDGSTGALVDPDGSEATITVYDSDQNSLETGTATRTDVGLYYYLWTVPTEPGTYTFEYYGLVATKPQLNRQKYKIKFVVQDD